MSFFKEMPFMIDEATRKLIVYPKKAIKRIKKDIKCNKCGNRFNRYDCYYVYHGRPEHKPVKVHYCNNCSKTYEGKKTLRKVIYDPEKGF
jgi:hypothetical protein